MGTSLAMKADYEKFPELPPGCHFNHNKKTGATQVYRLGKDRTPGCQMKRESVGYIRNGVFAPSKRWLMAQQLVALRGEKAPTQLSAVSKVAEIDERKRSMAEAVHSVPAGLLATTAVLAALSGCLEGDRLAGFLTRCRDGLKSRLSEKTIDSLTPALIWCFLRQLRSEGCEAFLLRLLRSTLATMSARSSDSELVLSCGDEPRFVTLSVMAGKKAEPGTVGLSLLEGVRLDGSVVSADAMEVSMGFAEAVLRANAHFCLRLGGVTGRAQEAVRQLFEATPASERLSCEQEAALPNGRTERQQIEVVAGVRLPRLMTTHWAGLEGGSVIRQTPLRLHRRGGNEVRFYFTSMAPSESNLAVMAEVLRSGERDLGGRRRLQSYYGDRALQSEPSDWGAREAVHQLARQLLENYALVLWNQGETEELLTVDAVQARCCDVDEGLRCIGAALRRSV